MTTLLEDFEKEFVQALAIGEGATFPALGTVITFPAYMKRADFERMTEEIQAVVRTSELRGEQKALAKLKATIGNLDGWKYCVMKVAGDDKASPD